jgi:predicted transcriptional regulator of viral defense system
MRFSDFKTHFEPFKVFSIQDILKWHPGFDMRRLVEWQDKGYIYRIINRWYVFNEPMDLNILYLISNRIYNPSYISFESALAHYRLIPEGVYTITAATSLKTQKFSSPVAPFSYRHLKPEIMFGYKFLSVAGQQCKIAEPEKLILDYLYLNPSLNTPSDFEAMRLNQTELESLINQQRLFDYLELIKSHALEKRIKLFLKVVLSHVEY